MTVPIRILVTAQVTLTKTFTVDETLTDAAGAVTVTATHGDGTTVVGSPFTATHTTTGTYTMVLPGQTTLDRITLTWTGTVAGAVVSQVDHVEIVGGFLFNLSDARTNYNLPAQKYPTAVLAAARTRVEIEAERICRQAFVPRYRRAVCSGNGSTTLRVPDNIVRSVRTVTVAGVALAGADLTAVGWSDSGTLTRAATWPTGVRNIVVEYEHGWDEPPPDLSDAAMSRLRTILVRPGSGVPARAQSYTTSDGSSFRLSSADRRHTGDMDVDATYERWTRAARAVVA